MPIDDDRMVEFVNEIDRVIVNYPEVEPHNIAAMLLSRVTLLCTMDPAVGKGLVKYVWEQLDAIEQADPGNFI
jgi:hypothetical protein